MTAQTSTIIECCGCGRFRVAAPSMGDACAQCVDEGERGRVWDSYKRAYVALCSQHDFVDYYDDDTDGGRRSDSAGRL